MNAGIPVTPRTILEAFLPSEGGVSLGVVYDTANAAGVGDQPLRLGLRRMVGAGEVVQRGRGRGGTIELTAAGRARLRADRAALRLAFAQDAGEARWDGRWRLLAVTAPESERAVRDLLRRRLAEAGASPVATSLHMSPHDLAGLLTPPQRAHLVTATATDIDVRGVTDPIELTELLWPREPTAGAYAPLDRLLAATDPASTRTAAATLVAQLRLADALERAMRNDPLIPLELREGAWEPRRVRTRWWETWRALESALPEPVLYRGWGP